MTANSKNAIDYFAANLIMPQEKFTDKYNKLKEICEARYVSYKDNNTGFPLKILVEAEGVKKNRC